VAVSYSGSGFGIKEKQTEFVQFQDTFSEVAEIRIEIFITLVLNLVADKKLCRSLTLVSNNYGSDPYLD
jgi:hypothetical protein